MPDIICINASSAPSLINFRGDLIRELIARGYEIHATAPDFSDEIRAELREMGCFVHDVPLTRAGTNPFGDLGYFASQLRLQRRLRAKLVLNYTVKPNIWASIAARISGTRAISMVTGAGYLLIEREGIKRKIIQFIGRSLYKFALTKNHAVIFQNKDDSNEFVAAGIVSPSQVRHVNGSGVNLDVYQPAPLPEAPVFLLIARLLKTKGVAEYLEAAALVRMAHPEARFLIVGPIDMSPDRINLPEPAVLAGAGIEYLGELADVRSAIASASVYVLPSYREGTPRSVLEAMAMGRPVITTDVPGCRETVETGVNGLLIPARDAKALADAMISLAASPADRARFGTASLKLVRERFDVRAVNRSLIAHLEL